jgi:hypothetical protein
VNFTDLATLPGADEKDIKGLRFGTEDGRWMVAASDRAVTEWIIWQRALPGDRRKVSAGYVRRVPWMRFVGEHAAEQAMFIAGVLDDMPASASLEVFRIAVKDAARDIKTRLMFRAISKVGELANDAHHGVEKSEDDLLR